jgi:chromosome partition protein MukF
MQAAPVPDLHETVARIATAGPRLDLGPVQICVLVAMRLVTQDEVLAELDEDRLCDLYVRVVEVVEGGSRLPRKKATHGLELLRQQSLLSRVDGAGLVRAGAYALTRLGVAIADSWLEDESLNRQSLVLLTTALRSNLGEVLSAAGEAKSEEQWDEIRQQLRVNVASLVEGIDRRRRGLDEQQAEVQSRVSELLAKNWYGALEMCEVLLDETTQTLAELKDILIRETGDLLNLLADIEGLASDSHADGAADAAREAQLKVDGIGAWGRARHEAWSEYFGAVQRFIREHVRMDPDRALSRRLQEAIALWPDDPWFLDVSAAEPYRHLREPVVKQPRVTVRRVAENREHQPELANSKEGETDLTARVLAWLDAHPHTTLSDALMALLPEMQRFRFAGRITRLLAVHGLVEYELERPWVSVDSEIEVEQWSIRHRQEAEY